MRILALETTEAVGSVAAIEDSNLLRQLELDSKKRSAAALIPGIRTLLDDVGWKPAEVQLVAVTLGPGSFTGLRVGVTAAKTFAYAVGAEVMGLDTLEVIAAGLPSEIPSVSIAIDAQRGDVVASSFRRGTDGCFQATAPARLLSVDAWLGGLSPGTTVAGPVLAKFTGRLPSHVMPVSTAYWPPTAANVGRLAARLYAAGRRDDLWTLAPRYSRRSAAEEKWDDRDRARPAE